MAKDRLATIFLGVEADVKQAMKDMDKFLVDSTKAAEKANEKIKESQKKIAEHQKKALQSSGAGEKQRMGWIDGYNKKIKEQLDYLKKLNSEKARTNKLIENEKKVLEALENQKDVQKAKMKDYNDFLKESAREHSRYADELSKRDRTTSLTENLSRGYQKGQIISEKFHPQENKMERASRSLNIAASAFTPTKGFAERQTDIFYRLQKSAYMLQTAFGTLAATIGDLVGGLMSLVAVAGQAVTGLVAIGGAMASMMAGMMAAKIALSGVGAAVQQLWTGQNQYNKALRDAKKAFRDLRFEAEQAALSEQEAAIALEKAREDFARMQDLPPDSRMYREGKLALDQAELNYRMAKAKTKDMQTQLKRGVVAPVDPFASLTKSQKVFAKYLLTLKPVVKELKESAASGFLPPLQKAIENIVETSLPTLNSALHTLGQGMGNASIAFSRAFSNRKNLKRFEEFAVNSKENIESMGKSAGNAFTGILNLLVAAQPLTKRFLDWTEKTTKNFANLMKIGQANGSIAKFLDPKAITTVTDATTGMVIGVGRARDFWKELGASGGKVIESLLNIMDAAFPENGKGGGWVMLDFITKVTKGFDTFTDSPQFNGWLKGSTENIVAAVTTIGDFMGIMIDLSGRPETKQFWETLQKAVPYVKKMFEDGMKAGPAFADVIVKVTEFISLLSDSAALKSFYETLGFIFGVFNSILTVIKPILDKMGAWHGVMLAVITVLVLLRKGAIIFMGILAKMSRTVGKTTGAIINFGERVTIARRAMNKPLMPGLGKLSTVQIPAAATAMTKFRIATTNAAKISAASIGGVAKAMMSMNAQSKSLKKADYMMTMAKSSDRVTQAINESVKGITNLKDRGKAAKAAMRELKAEMEAIATSAATTGKTVSYSQLTSGPMAQKYGADKLGGRAAVGGRVARYGGAALGGAVGLGSALGQMSEGGAGNVMGGIGSGLMAAGGVLAMTGVGMPIALGVEAAGMIATAIGGAITAEEDKKKTIQIAKADIRVLQQTNAENALAAVMQAANLNLSEGQKVLDDAMAFTASAVQAAKANTGVGIKQDDANLILQKVMIDSPEIAKKIAANPALAAGVTQAGAQIAGARGLKFGNAEEKAASSEAISLQIQAAFERSNGNLTKTSAGLIAQNQGRVIRKDEYMQGGQQVLTKAQAVAFSSEAAQGGALKNYKGPIDVTGTDVARSLNELVKQLDNARKDGDETRITKYEGLVKAAYGAVKQVSMAPGASGIKAVKTNIQLPFELDNMGKQGVTNVGPRFGAGQLGNWNSANVFGKNPAGIYSLSKPNATEVKLAKGDSGALVDAATGMVGLSKSISSWATKDGKLVTVVDKDPKDNVAPQFMVPAGLNKNQKTFLEDLNTQLAKAWAVGG